MNAAHDAVHANMYDTTSKDVDGAVSEAVYGTVYVGVRRRVRTPVGNAVDDAVYSGLYKTTVFDLTNIDKVRELI